jgi:Zn-dependent peptidase ImmA (M78 family)
MDIAKKAKIIKYRFKTLNPYELAEAMDIIIIDTPLPNGTHGFFQHYKRIKIIYLNEKLNTHDRLQTLAHELSHAFLHAKMNRIFLDRHTYIATNEYENEANLLASYMLLDDFDLKNYINNQFSKQQIVSITGIDKRIIEKRIQCL